MRRVTRKPRVIAGLMWPPEIGPAAETITAITRPFANARSIGDRAKCAHVDHLSVEVDRQDRTRALRDRSLDE